MPSVACFSLCTEVFKIFQRDLHDDRLPLTAQLPVAHSRTRHDDFKKLSKSSILVPFTANASNDVAFLHIISCKRVALINICLKCGISKTPPKVVFACAENTKYDTHFRS